jgi:hypothetical protein
MKHCNREAAHKQNQRHRHILSCACALPVASLGASPPLSPHIPRIEPQPTETWRTPTGSHKHLSSMQSIPRSSQHGTASPAPASVHVDCDPTHATSLHSATPADRRGRRCRCVTARYLPLSVPFRAALWVGLADVYGFGMGWIRLGLWRSRNIGVTSSVMDRGIMENKLVIS